MTDSEDDQYCGVLDMDQKIPPSPGHSSEGETDKQADEEVRHILSKWKKSKRPGSAVSVKGKPVEKKSKIESVDAEDDVNEWTVEDVQKWLNVKGFKEECELFRAENICGKALRAIERADLKEMGVKTMGRRILLIEEIQALLGSSCNHTATESDHSFSKPMDRLLTHSEKKKLTMEDKGIYYIDTRKR
ncbi:hypothetical protein OS493_036551 [Desmophyllum pertusum]|uniref:SAM domain-containing protein n=1 Tax=Desmophyllum pertusum TaxID=174260 RepID=A0A9X0CNF3_9CNID|nr:hypothetical protein OS493_036551 [Desmophyllum pertusum]